MDLAKFLTERGVRVGALGKPFAPGYGWCFKCLTPWAFIEGHSTFYRDGRGCLPLCTLCWGEMTPEERLPYYRQLWEEWAAGYAEWSDIERAVAAGG